MSGLVGMGVTQPTARIGIADSAVGAFRPADPTTNITSVLPFFCSSAISSLHPYNVTVSHPGATQNAAACFHVMHQQSNLVSDVNVCGIISRPTVGCQSVSSSHGYRSPEAPAKSPNLQSFKPLPSHIIPLPTCHRTFGRVSPHINLVPKTGGLSHFLPVPERVKCASRTGASRPFR